MLREGRVCDGVERLCGRSESFQERRTVTSRVARLLPLQALATLDRKPSTAGMKTHSFSSKTLELLLWGWDIIAQDLLGDQLAGLWRPFCSGMLISPQSDDSFLPSKEQSVFVNWAAGVLIGSSV